jgi:hypothetical protein
MDMTLASIVLALLLIVALILHEHKRREANRLRAELEHTQAQLGTKIREAKRMTLFEGYRLCQADAYVAVLKAESRGRSPLEALRELTPPAIVEQAEKRLEWIPV